MRRPAKNEVNPLVLAIVLQAVLFQQYHAIFGDRKKANYPVKAELESTRGGERRKPPKTSEWAASNKSTVMIRQEKAVAGSDRASFVEEAGDVQLISGCTKKGTTLGSSGTCHQQQRQGACSQRSKANKGGPRQASGAFWVLP